MPKNLENGSASSGILTKPHPEYRIPGKVLLDFKHQAVRDFKLAILREAAEAGADGISMDFAVYPPYFAKPDKTIMTQFVRDARAMLDDVGRKQGRRLELMTTGFPTTVRPSWGWTGKPGCKNIWSTISFRHKPTFSISTSESSSRWAIGRASRSCPRSGRHSDWSAPTPSRATRRRASDVIPSRKPKGCLFAQAMLLHRAGVDGLQFGFAADEWKHVAVAQRVGRSGQGRVCRQALHGQRQTALPDRVPPVPRTPRRRSKNRFPSESATTSPKRGPPDMTSTPRSFSTPRRHAKAKRCKSTSTTRAPSSSRATPPKRNPRTTRKSRPSSTKSGGNGASAACRSGPNGCKWRTTQFAWFTPAFQPSGRSRFRSNGVDLLLDYRLPDRPGTRPPK